MLQTKTKIFLTVCALAWMVGAAIAASPVKADFVPCPGNTCPEPSGTRGGGGTRLLRCAIGLLGCPIAQPK